MVESQCKESDVGSLYYKLEESKTRLKNLDADITKLTGRDPSERRFISDNRRLNINRNIQNWSSTDKFDKRSRQKDSRFYDGKFDKSGSRNTRCNDNVLITPTKQKGMIASSIIVKPDDVISRSEEINNESKSTSSDLKKRNKRMFGMLMGTLNQFKSQENKIENKYEMRKQVEKRIEDKAIEEKKNQYKEKMELFSMRKEEKRKIFETKFKVEVAEMHEKWDKSKKSLMPFIKTNHKPSIFFHPCNINENEKLLHIHELSCKRIQDEISERRFHFDSSIKKHDEKNVIKKEDQSKMENKFKREIDDSDIKAKPKLKIMKKENCTSSNNESFDTSSDSEISVTSSKKDE